MRRLLTKLVLFLVLGAILNVAVAWGLAYWIAPWGSAGAYGGFILTSWFGKERSFSVMVHRRVGASAVIVWQSTMARSDFDMITAGQGSSWTPPGQVDIPPWSAAAHAWDTGDELPQPRTPVALVQWLVDEARGWPMQGMRYRYFYLNTAENPYVIDIEMCNGLELPSPGNSVFGWPLPQALPLRPIWRSFAGNTLFYGAILWLVIPGPFTLRRLIRRKRGHCIKCGYDLRGAEHEACPECGARCDGV